MNDGPAPSTVWVRWCAPQAPRPGLLALLDDAERARHARLVRAEDRARHVTAHALLRLCLGRRLDQRPDTLRLDRTCPECGGAHGKPRLPGGEVEFSLTHSGALVGVALAQVPVGIDVESRAGSAYDPALAGEALSAAERAHLEAMAPSRRAAGFLRYWTRKEAVLKALGTGLTLPLHDLEVSSPHEPPQVLRSPYGGAVQLHDLAPDPDHPGALAALSESELTVSQAYVTELDDY